MLPLMGWNEYTIEVTKINLIKNESNKYLPHIGSSYIMLCKYA
jgi:hypothetical protein